MATKGSQQHFTVKCKITVPFYEYGTKAKNTKARNQIKRWIKETLVGDCSFISLYVERDEFGSPIEDCSGPTKIKVND